MKRTRQRRTRLIESAFTITSFLLLARCTSTSDCAAGNPLMPVCFDPRPAEPQMVFLRAWDSTWTRSDIYTMNADGTNLRRLTLDGMLTQKLTPSQPVWSPTGDRIAFARRADNTAIRAQLYVMASDGSNLRNISNQTAAFDWAPSWSPDGRRIVFQSDRHSPATGACCVTSLYVMEADGSNVQRLTTGFNDKLPRWSPDGSTIVFNSNRVGNVNQIFVMNVDGSNVRQLTTEGTSRRAVWSGDGTMIAFEGTRDPAAGGMGSGIYVMHADGSAQMNVSPGLAMTMSPSWQSDGREVFFCGARVSTGRMQVFKVAMGGGDVRQVSDDHTEDCCPDTKQPRRSGGFTMSR